MASQRERAYANHVKKVKAIKDGSFLLEALGELGSPAHLNQIIMYIANRVKLPPQRVEFNVMCSIQEGVVAGCLKMSASQFVDLQNFKDVINHRNNVFIFKALGAIGAPSTAEQIITYVAEKKGKRQDEVRGAIVKALEKAVTYGFLGLSNKHYYIDFHDLPEFDPELYDMLNENELTKEPPIDPTVIATQDLWRKDSIARWEERFKGLLRKKKDLKPEFTHTALLLNINKMLHDAE